MPAVTATTIRALTVMSMNFMARLPLRPTLWPWRVTKRSEAILHDLVAEGADVDFPVRNDRRGILREVTHVVGGFVIAVKQLLQSPADEHPRCIVRDERSVNDHGIRVPLRWIHTPDHACVRSG